MLYSDDAVMAITAGMAYCISNFPTFSVPNAIGAPSLDTLFVFSDAKLIKKGG